MRIDVPQEQADQPYAFAFDKLAPEIMAASGVFSKTVYQHSKLSLREFEAARYRTAQINGCMICQQFRAARDLGQLYSGLAVKDTVAGNGPAPDEAFYAAVERWREAVVFSEREKLAMEFAERFAEAPQALATDEAFWSRFRARFSDEETIDLAHCVACWVGLGRVAHVIGFDQVCLTGAPAPKTATPAA